MKKKWAGKGENKLEKERFNESINKSWKEKKNEGKNN